MKKCPFCSEEIQDSAKKCRHCGEWIKEVLNDPKENRTSSENQVTKKTTETQKELSGIGLSSGLRGWLLFPFLGLFYSLWIHFTSLKQLMGVYFAHMNNFPVMFTLTFEVLMGIGLLLLSIYCIYLFIKTNKRLPATYIKLYVLATILAFVDYQLATHLLKGLVSNSALDSAYDKLLQSFIIAVIWIIYFLRSKKVKAIFVR